MAFTGHLTRVGDGRLLDLAPVHSADPASLLIPAHFAVRLQLLGDALTATAFDYDWFLRETEQGRLTKLRSVLDSRKNVVLTAETATLRAWRRKPRPWAATRTWCCASREWKASR